MMIIVFLELLPVEVSGRYGSEVKVGVGGDGGLTAGFTGGTDGTGGGAETGGLLGLAGVSILLFVKA